MPDYRDWGGYGAILNDPPTIRERVDCPVCGEVLDVRDGIWNCPRQGGKHWRNPYPPKD